MQTLYAFHQSEASNFHNSLDFIGTTFAPDLNSNEVQDLKKLEENQKQASGLFENYFLKDAKKDIPDPSVEIAAAANKAVLLYKTEISKDQKYFKKIMLDEIDKLYDRYLRILILLAELADFAAVEVEEKKSKYIKEEISSINEAKFLDNFIVKSINSNTEIQQSKIRKNLAWDNHTVKQLYKSALMADPVFIKYLSTSAQSFEEDKEIGLHILKSIIFKDKLLQIRFEEEDLNWVENRSIVKSMVVKTIKAIDQENTNISLLEISNNWEEDKAFFEELYSRYIEHNEELEKILIEKTKNWDIERIASVDKIIIKLAICEMLNFQSIPVKVTINEYIELSKIYSTPKSKQFVNGVLDKTAADLINKGLIKKSGRGLIDNK